VDIENVIDLGEDVKIKVKYKGKEYSLREPMVEEVEALSGENGMANFKAVDFLSKLGMPADVLNKMPMSKVKGLVEGLTDMLLKKK
jgi:hypothetical protein